jgi:anti-sigma regulatory factor (Ser/Thr protein kinase)
MAEFRDQLTQLAHLPTPHICAGLLDWLERHHAPRDDAAIVVARLVGSTTRHHTNIVNAKLSNIRVARHALRSWLRSLAVPTPVEEQLLIAASEAVTNAITYGSVDDASTVIVEACLDDDAIVICVRDRGTWSATGQPDSLNATGGRGIALMHALCDRVDIDSSRRHGTTVTLRLSLQQNHAMH